MGYVLNLCPTVVDIYIAHGDIEPWTFTIRSDDWTPTDLTGLNLYLYLYSTPHTTGHDHAADTTEPFILEGTVTDAAAGVVEFALSSPAADSALGSYYYEVIATSGANSRVLFNGNMTFVEDMCGCMPETDVGICNMALSFLGDADGIQSVNPPDPSVQAQTCKRFYDISLKATLEMQNWAFATRTVALVECHPTENESWDFCYEIPEGMLKPIAIVPAVRNDDHTEVRDYSIETDSDGVLRIFTDEEDAVLRYVECVTFTRLFPPLFVTAFAWHLASMLAGALIKGAEGAAESKRCLSMMRAYLGESSISDARHRNVHPTHTPSWMSNR